MNSSTHPIAQPRTDVGQNYKNAATAVSLGFLLLVLYFRFYVSKRKGLRLPPGPRGLPIVGNLHQIGKLPHHTMTKLSKEYGEIFSLRFGSKLAVVVSSPETAREVLKTQDQNFASRPHTTNGVIRCHNRQNIVWAPYGPAWRFLRKVCLLELFTVKRIGEFQNVRREEIMNFVLSVLEAGSNGGLVQLDEKLSELATNNITRMVFNRIYFGSKSPRTHLGEAKEFQVLVQDCFRTAGATVVGDVIPFLHKLDLGGHVAKMWEVRRKFDAFFGAILAEHRQKRKTNPDPHIDPEDFVDVLLSLGEDAKSGNEMTDSRIQAVLGDMLLGGTETTANQITWAITELMRHPEMRKRVQSELDEVVGQDRLVEESDLPQLKYLEAVAKENFRLHPVGPLLVPHESIAATKIAGFDIPAQTRVYVNIYAIQRDPRVWEDPLTFDPERFLNQSNNVSVRGQDFELLPFGSGRRMCPGIHLALISVQLTLAQMLHTCDFSLPPGTTPEQVSIDERFGLTAPRAHPLEVLVRPRLPRWSELQTAAAL